MASTGSKPRLAKLFMFNSNWGLKEGMENEKIIYFWPNDTGKVILNMVPRSWIFYYLA